MKKRAQKLLVRLNDYKSLGDSRTLKEQGRRRRRKSREAPEDFIQDESDVSDVPPIGTSTPDKGTDLSSKKRFRGEENRNLGVSGIVGSGSVSPSGDQASMDPKKQKLGEIGKEGTMVDDDGLQDTSSVNSEISHELDQLRQQGKDPNATC